MITFPCTSTCSLADMIFFSRTSTCWSILISTPMACSSMHQFSMISLLTSCFFSSAINATKETCKNNSSVLKAISVRPQNVK